MNLSDFTPLIVFGLTLVMGGGATYFLTHLPWSKVEKATRDLLPDEIETLGVKAAMQAYKFVEQKAKTVVDLDNAGKLALARQVFDALLDFYQHGNLTDLAKEALIELEVYAQHDYPKWQTSISTPSVSADHYTVTVNPGAS